jgi:hypothetical protein
MTWIDDVEVSWQTNATKDIGCIDDDEITRLILIAKRAQAFLKADTCVTHKCRIKGWQERIDLAAACSENHTEELVKLSKLINKVVERELD